MLWIVENLECLVREESRKRKLDSFVEDASINVADDVPFWSRQDINAFDESSFVALSYTWEASEHETQNPKEEGHVIQTRDRKNAFRSGVRNSVLERITMYMQRHQVPLLWIDRHSIPQKVCDQPTCKHEACNKKQHALDAMDRVYSLSDHPVALLGRPIETEDEMATLAAILNGSLVEYQDGSFRLSPTTTEQQAREALQVLYDITRDKWWTRAWTFQENYRAGIKMTLLIHHGPHLEKTKRSFRRSRKPIFGLVPGELSIQSVKFSESATKFCLALHHLGSKTRKEEDAIKHILRTAGKYTLLLQESTSMSGTIVSDILARGVTEPWDLLAIIANCCQYSTRLNITKLQQLTDKGLSLSLSILVLRLLNGEILKNDDAPPSTDNAVDLINSLFFDGFQAPGGEKRLTYNKGCRFVRVKLTKEGITTTGHLWRLDETVKPPRAPRRVAEEANKGRKQLSGYQRQRLERFIELIKAKREKKHLPLASDIDEFLEEDAFVGEDEASFSLKYRRLMAKELVRAMDADQELSIGCLCDPADSNIPPRFGVFIHDPSTRSSDVTHVFTSLRSRDQGTDEYDGNDLDHHVSLGVAHEDPPGGGRKKLPRLYAKKWVLGLCFFQGAPTYDVVFPWPRYLTESAP
ncbi:hypothetical protein ACJ41O_012993 [Fusarium nematophilum]